MVDSSRLGEAREPRPGELGELAQAMGAMRERLDGRTQREQCDRWSPSQNPSSEPTAKRYGLRRD